MKKLSAIELVFDVQQLLHVPSVAVLVIKFTGDQQEQYATAIALAEEGQSTLMVMLRGTALPRE